MPAPAIKSLAAKAGKSEAEGERLWKKAKEAAKGSKLKGGTTIGSSESAWGNAEWAYVTGVFKKMLGLKEADACYRVVLNGDEVQMIHNGAQVPLGESGDVELVRGKIQDLLDHDIDSIFDLGGFTGTLSEIEQQVFREWVLFCTGDKPMTVYASDGGK